MRKFLQKKISLFSTKQKLKHFPHLKLLTKNSAAKRKVSSLEEIVNLKKFSFVDIRNVKVVSHLQAIFARDSSYESN